MKKIDYKKLKEVIIAKLQADFDDIEIVKVNVSPGVDRDGDEYLDIQVVFDGKLKASSARHLAGAARLLRPTLDELEADFYPLLSFVSKIEYDKGHGKGAAN